jgi:dihydroorotate dehydrogenase (NAD+) catalytic subunit
MSKHDLAIDPRLMNAAGSLGFTPDLHGAVDWSGLGAFVTNPVSLTSRTPARGRRMIEFPGGFLLHTGYPNPGISQVIRQYARQWQRSPIPVIVHLLAENPQEVEKMARRLESVEGISGLELGVRISLESEMLELMTRAACGELPVIVQVPLERAIELAPKAVDAGADAISLAPTRGMLRADNGELVQGRLYGPVSLPLALRAVHELSQMRIATIGAGGVYTREQAESMLAAGAVAVQLDAVFWRGAGYRLFT